MPHAIRSFSEREFYLAEFRGRSIGIAWPAEERPVEAPLAGVVDQLASNGSRVVVLSPVDAIFGVAGLTPSADAAEPGFGPKLWHALRGGGRAGLRVGAATFAEDCRDAALSLGLAKLVWIGSEPPVEASGGDRRVSVVDLAHLERLLAGEDLAEDDATHRVRPGCARMLAAIQEMIEGGVASVNVCAPADLERELFTYAGAGTFFTRDRYADVRPLGLDDYEIANDLIERGEADGFLAPRDPEARDAVLAHGVGVFIEGRYLAGIGAILPHPSARAAELVSLFALTRYVGEGAGGQIVRYAIERSRADGLDYLFCCTTSDRVEAFFERQGFVRVAPDAVPPGKWTDYDPARRERVRCLRFDLAD